MTAPTVTTPTTTTPSNAQNPSDGTIVTNSVDVLMQSTSDAINVSDSLLKGNPDRQRNKGGYDGAGIVSSAQNASLANAVKRISQANNIDVISR